MAKPLTLRRDEELPPTIGRVKAMVNAGVKPMRIAIEAGIKHGDLKLCLDGKPTADDIEDRLADWLEDIDQGNADQGEPAWVPTPTSQRLVAGFEYSRRTPTIGVFYGGAGVGKTSTAHHYKEIDRGDEKGRTFYISASNFTRTPSAVLFKIAEAVEPVSCTGSLTARAYRNYSLAQAILDTIRPDDLFIVDESQHLEAAALDSVRMFHDEAGIGVCYLGNEAVYTRISGKGRRAEFAQLHSRVGMRLHIVAPEEGDIDAILEAWGVLGNGERGFSHQIARGPGGLRQLTNVLRQSRIVAQDMKQPVDLRVMRAAAESLGINE